MLNNVPIVQRPILTSLLFVLLLSSASFALNVSIGEINEFLVSDAPAPEYTMSSAYDGTNFLIAWSCPICTGSGNTHAQLVSPSGELINTKVKTGMSGNGMVFVDYDGSNYLMAWIEYSPIVYGQFVTPQGAALGSQFPIAEISAEEVNSLVFGKNTHLVVAADGTTVYGALVTRSSSNAAGFALTGDFTISKGAGQDTRRLAATAFDGTNYLVTWLDGRRGTPPMDIYGQFVSETGSLIGNEFVIYEGSDELEFLPYLIFDGTNYLFVWTESVNDQWDVYGRFISTEGKTMSDRFAIANSSVDERFGRVIFDGEDYLVIWSERLETGQSKIMGRIITGSRELTDSFTLLDKNQNGLPAYGSLTHFDGKTLLAGITRCQSFLQNPAGGPALPVEGNIYGISATINKIQPKPADAIAPFTSVSAVDENGVDYLLGAWKKAQYITVTLQCDDGDGSGCKATQYCVDQTNACSPLKDYTTSIQISSEGTSYVRYLSKDNADNIEYVQSATVNIDNTPPTVSINSPKPNTQINDRRIAVQFTVTEENLNYVNVSIMQDGRVVNSTIVRVTGTSTVVLGVPSDGTYDVLVTGYDNASSKQISKVTGITIATTGTPSTTCKNEGEKCTSYADCCSNICMAGTCTASAPEGNEKAGLPTELIIAAVLVIVVIAGVLLAMKMPRKPKATPQLPAASQPSVPQPKAQAYGPPAQPEKPPTPAIRPPVKPAAPPAQPKKPISSAQPKPVETAPPAKPAAPTLDARLLEWVRQGRFRGHTSDVLRAHLVKKGYKKDQIDRAIAASEEKAGPPPPPAKPPAKIEVTKPEEPREPTQKQIVSTPDERILAWVRKNRLAGYDFDRLKDYLMKKGLPRDEVDKAIAFSWEKEKEGPALPPTKTTEQPSTKAKPGKAPSAAKSPVKSLLNEKILELIKTSRALGYDYPEIRAHIVKEGYPEEEVDIVIMFEEAREKKDKK